MSIGDVGSTESRESGGAGFAGSGAGNREPAQGHGPAQALPDPRGPADRAQGGGGPGIDGVSFEIQPGETLGLVGESGSGKSTTGYCVLQLLKPTSGSVLFEGAELTELGREDIRRMRREMQIVFQDPYSSLDPRMTVGDIVGEPLVVHGIGTRRDRSARIRDLLDVVGFNPGFTNRYPHEFSAASGSGSGSHARSRSARS